MYRNSRWSSNSSDYYVRQKKWKRIKIIVFILCFILGAIITQWKISCWRAYKDYTGITANPEFVNKHLKD